MFCDVVKLSSIQEEREESKKKMLLSLADIQVCVYLNHASNIELFMCLKMSKFELIYISFCDLAFFWVVLCLSLMMMMTAPVKTANC